MSAPQTRTLDDPGEDNALLHELRDGWTPLPLRAVFSLVLAGLRVRMSRSVVTLITVVLAIAFLTYTGLSAKLYRNLALLAQELTETPGPQPAEVRDATAGIQVSEIADGLPAEPAQWLPLWLPESASTLRDRLEARGAPPGAAVQETDWLALELELTEWKESGAASGVVSSEHALEFFQHRAERLLRTFRNPGVWTAEQFRQAEFLSALVREQPGNAELADLLDAVLENEHDKRDGATLLTLLRRAGVNIEATLRGSVADVWIIVMALMLCTVGIANAMLMSVTERFREIGTMKCLGAQDGLVVKLFLLESAFLGVFGAFFGILLGILVALLAALLQFGGFGISGFPLLQGVDIMFYALLSGIFLAVAGTLYPAVLAARMKPVDALRIDE